jgi:DtxR family transcriptional regulator, Mn-dependent transcriptional regulator
MDQSASHKLTQAVGDYLKAVYHLGGPGRAVATTALAEQLDVAPPSVTAMVKRLSEMGYVNYEPRQGVALTAAGLRRALEVIRHHRLLEVFFVQRLGMDWAAAHREAEILEHFISEELEAIIDAQMGHPSHDPQGAPIPTLAGDIDHSEGPALDEVEVGRHGVIARIRQEQPELLAYIEQLGLVPGRRVTVRARAPFGGPVEVEVSGKVLHLGLPVAHAIQVRAAQKTKRPARQRKASQS